MADLAHLRVAVDSRQVVQAEKDLNSLASAGARAEGSANNLARATSGLGRALAGIGIGLGIAELVRMADAYTSMQSRIRLVTKSQAELAAVQSSLFDIAQRSRSEYETTGELYARLARSASNLGKSQADVLAVTEAINKATIVSGATSQEATAAIIQLSQGMASGTLRGEELNSVLEQTPRVAKMIADGMGISIGQLREFGKEGKLTSESVFNALLKMKDGVDGEFKQMDATVGQSLTVLRNAVMNLVGQFNDALGITSSLSKMIIALAENLNLVIAAAGVLATRFVALKASMAVSFVTGYIRSLVALEMALGATSTRMALFSIASKQAQAAIRALTMTMAVNPFVAIATAIAAVVALLYTYRDANVNVAGETIRLGDVFLGVWELIKRATVFVQKLFTEGWAEAFGYISPALRSVGEFFGKVFTFIGNMIRNTINGWVGLFVGLGRAIKAVFTEEGVADAFRSALGVDYVGAFGKAAAGAIVGLAEIGRNARTASASSVDLRKSIVGVTGATVAQTKADKDANKEREQQLKAAQDYIESLKQQAAEIGLNAIQVKQLEINNKANEAAVVGLAEETRKYGAALIEAMRKDIVDQQQERLAIMREEVALFWASNEAIAQANAVRQAEKEGLIAGTQAWKDYVNAATEMARLENTKKGLEEIKQALEDVKGMTFDINFDAVFGTFGKALAGVLEGLNTFVDRQTQINKAMQAGNLTIQEQMELQEKSFRNQINGYGNIASAAKGFFKEGSDGYKALQAAETAFRAVELALAIKNAAVKLGLITTETTAVVSGEATKTAAITGAEILRTGAALAQAAIRIPVKIAEGAASMFAALGPAGFAAVAGMVAVMAGFGFGGGGSKTLAPANEGKGTVFGDLEKQSESITKSLNILSKVDTATMRYSAQMASSLKNIEAAIGGVTNIVLRSTGLQNMSANANTGYGGITNTISSVFSKAGDVLSSNITTGIAAGLGFFAGGPIGAIAMALGSKILGGVASLVGKLVNTLFGSKTSVVGQGIFGGGQTLASIMAEGFEAQYYTDLKTKKKFFGITTSTRYKTEFAAADEEINRQFGLIFENIYNSVLAAAVPLGQTTDEITNRLNNFTVQLGKIDIKGLTGEQIQEKLTAVFGAAADNIAKAAIPGLEEFQRVGEGYFETLVRVASSIEVLDRAFQMLGQTTQGLTLQSQMALIETFGDATSMMEQVNEYFSLFYSEAEQVAAMSKQLGDALGVMGLTMPDTLAGFRKLVEAQDLNTEAGRRTYAALIELSPTFANFIERQKELAEETANTASLVGDLSTGLGAANDNAADYTNITNLTNEQIRLQIELLKAQGDTAGALNLQREAELRTMDASLVPLQKLIWATQDAASAQDALNAALAEGTRASLELARNRRALEIRLLEEQGKKEEVLAARRADELASTDALLQPLLRLIYAQEDLNAANEKAAKQAANSLKIENERTEQIKIRNAVEEEARAARVSAADALRKAYDIESEALGNTIKQFSDLAETLREFSNSILPLAGNGPASIAQLNEQFMQTAMLARLGNTEAMAALPGIGGELRDAIIANATDRVSMMRQLAAMKFETDEALATADRQVSIAQNQLDAMTAQVSELITLNDNVLSLRDAILGVKKLDPRRPVSDFAIPSEYMTMRGGYDQRLADMYSGTGVDHYISANEAPSIAPYLPKGQYVMLPNGTIVPKGSSSHIAAIEAQSLDYEAFYGVSGFPRMIADINAAHGYASGGIHSGGLRIVGENGPELEATGPSRIYNANQLSDMMNNRTTAEEVKSLRDELKLAMYQIAKNTGKSYDLLNRWDGDGLPPERIVA